MWPQGICSRDWKRKTLRERKREEASERVRFITIHVAGWLHGHGIQDHCKQRFLGVYSTLEKVPSSWYCRPLKGRAPTCVFYQIFIDFLHTLLAMTLMKTSMMADYSTPAMTTCIGFKLLAIAFSCASFLFCSPGPLSLASIYLYIFVCVRVCVSTRGEVSCNLVPRVVLSPPHCCLIELVARANKLNKLKALFKPCWVSFNSK